MLSMKLKSTEIPLVFLLLGVRTLAKFCSMEHDDQRALETLSIKDFPFQNYRATRDSLKDFQFSTIGEPPLFSKHE